jgi:hypothetical protein
LAFTDTVSVPGVVAFPGATESQVVFEVAVKAVAVPVLVIFKVCADGAVPPIACENDNDAGVAVSDAADTVSVTGTMRVVVPAVTVIAPWFGPTASPDALALTDTVRVAGVVAFDVGATVSQVTVEAAVKAVAVPVLVILTVCAAGAAPPTVCENDTEVGVAVTAPPPPAVTVMPTFTICCS